MIGRGEEGGARLSRRGCGGQVGCVQDRVGCCVARVCVDGRGGGGVGSRSLTDRALVYPSWLPCRAQQWGPSMAGRPVTPPSDCPLVKVSIDFAGKATGVCIPSGSY